MGFRCGSLDGPHHLVPTENSIDSLCRPAGIHGALLPACRRIFGGSAGGAEVRVGLPSGAGGVCGSLAAGQRYLQTHSGVRPCTGIRLTA